MDKWSTLKGVLEYDKKMFEDLTPQDPDTGVYASNAVKILRIYLALMEKLEEADDDGGGNST